MIGPVLIPAAGRSVRMGRPKLLLPLDGRTVIEYAIEAARLAGIESVVVVHPDDAELAEVVGRAGANVVRLPAPTPDMRATVLAGLDWIERRGPAPSGFFLMPGDLPTLTPEVFIALLGKGTIALPTFQGRRGHPVWIAWSHVPALRTMTEGQGLNSYLRTQPIAEVVWSSSNVLVDVDTPDDYADLLRLRAVVSRNYFARVPGTMPSRVAALLPGSFNPIHGGHWGLAAAASDILNEAVAFEISRVNVDKPPLDDVEVARRAAQFAGRADLWVTRAPRFFGKAELFPKATFIVGADTAARLTDARYHDGDDARLASALDRIAALECRFLVAARAVSAGLMTLDDLTIPVRWRSLFDAIPTSRFRLDVSSTDLRREVRA